MLFLVIFPVKKVIFILLALRASKGWFYYLNTFNHNKKIVNYVFDRIIS